MVRRCGSALVLSLLWFQQPTAAELTGIIAALKPSVVRVSATLTDTVRGESLYMVSAAILDPDGLIISPEIDPSARVEITFSDGSTCSAELLATDKMYRVTYLRASALPAGSGFVRISPRAPPAGTEILTVGHVQRRPESDGYFAVSRGIVSSDMAELDHSNALPGYLLATDVLPTSQQSLLFDSDGDLLSVTGLFATMPGRSTGAIYYPLTSIPAWLRDSRSQGIVPEHGGMIGVQLDGPRRLTVSRSG